MKRTIRWGVVAATLAVTATAWGTELWVNGVKVDRLEPATIPNCTVEIDASGNVRVTTPRNAALVPADAPSQTAGAPSAEPPSP
jgi:hypothetical protein